MNRWNCHEGEIEMGGLEVQQGAGQQTQQVALRGAHLDRRAGERTGGRVMERLDDTA